MLNKQFIKISEYTLNSVALIGILISLIVAFIFQFAFHELPCPLCLLQRIGFLCVAFGFLLNLHFGLRPSHYAIINLSALLTAFISLRQIALHILPGSGAYGTTFFGFHLYTWSFIVAILILIGATIMLGIDRQYQTIKPNNKYYKYFTNFLFIIFILLLAGNLIAVFLECGLNQCPDNPVGYKFSLL